MNRFRQILLFAFIFSAACAQQAYADCALPPAARRIDELVVYRDFWVCIEKAVRELRAKQELMEQELKSLREILADTPAPYLNDNGAVTRQPGRRIGQARFVLNARQTFGATALQIDQAVLEELCSNGGCQIRLAKTEIGLFNAEPTGTDITRPCGFDYDSASGAWARSGGCGSGPGKGVDGNGRPGATAGGAEEIAAVAGSCVIADADLGRSGQSYSADWTKGIYLIAQRPEGSTGSRFICELEIE